MAITKQEYGSAYEQGLERTVHFLLSRGLSEEEAEDAAQAAWTRGWEKRESLRQPESIVGWVNSIALNIFRNKFRRERRKEQLPDADISVAAGAMASRVDVERGMSECSAEDRALLHQLYLGGYSSKEIGLHWNLKPSTVRVRIFRARQKLRGYLSGRDGRAGCVSRSEKQDDRTRANDEA